MIWTVRWTSRAEKDRGRLDSKVRKRILEAIHRYAESGVGDVIRLKEPFHDEWRLSVGKWRVRFRLDEKERILLVLHVLPRDKAYGVREPAEGFGKLAAGVTVTSVTFDEDAMQVSLSDARRISIPLAWYPRLLDAAPEQRWDWELIGDGEGIHWPSVDEDLSVGGTLRGARAPGAIV